MKKPASDKNAGKKKPASGKMNAIDEKKMEKYKKQSLNPEEEEDDETAPSVEDVDFELDNFDDFDDEDEEDY